jgi:hypothetical protein
MLREADTATRYLEMTKLLLDKGADVNSQNGAYHDILSAAFATGALGIVKLLLDYRPTVNAHDGKDTIDIYELAKDWVRAHEIIKLLLNGGMQISDQEDKEEPKDMVEIQ